jgi:hypothetical protein
MIPGGILSPASSAACINTLLQTAFHTKSFVAWTTRLPRRFQATAMLYTQKPDFHLPAFGWFCHSAKGPGNLHMGCMRLCLCGWWLTGLSCLCLCGWWLTGLLRLCLCGWWLTGTGLARLCLCGWWLTGLSRLCLCVCVYIYIYTNRAGFVHNMH